jgi:hypothetical protein
MDTTNTPEEEAASSATDITKTNNGTKTHLVPISTIVSLLLTTVIGFALAYYFYEKQKQVKSLALNTSYSVLLFSPQNIITKKLKLVNIENKDVSKNVYFSKVYIWNDGTVTISGKDIILPLKITSAKKIEFLDIQQTRTSRPSVTNLSLTQTEGDNIKLNFLTLEPDEGMTFIVFYSGDSATQFSLSGAIEGIKSFKNNELAEKKKFWESANTISPYLMIPLGILIFFPAIPVFLLRKSIDSIEAEQRILSNFASKLTKNELAKWAEEKKAKWESEKKKQFRIYSKFCFPFILLGTILCFFILYCQYKNFDMSENGIPRELLNGVIE